MTTFLSWLWTRAELTAAWRRVSLRRHRAELRALRAAQAMGPLAIFPIFLTVGMWFFLLAGIPSLILFALVQTLAAIGGAVGTILSAMAFVVYSIFGLVALYFAAPWLFGWYVIAAALMRGAAAKADRKERDLMNAIETATGTT